MPELLTGYSQFDTITGGLQQADVLTVATSPPGDGVGLALSIALNVASASRHRVGLVALTMNKRQIALRLLAVRSGIDQHRLCTGQMKAEEWQRVKAATRQLSMTNLRLDDPGTPHMVELCQRSRQLVETCRLSLLIIDDLSPLQRSRLAGPLEMQLHELGKVGLCLRTLACELNIPVVVCIPLAHSVAYAWRADSQCSDLADQARTRGVAHFLFLSREESTPIRRTGALQPTRRFLPVTKVAREVVTDGPFRFRTLRRALSGNKRCGPLWHHHGEREPMACNAAIAGTFRPSDRLTPQEVRFETIA